MRTTGGLLGNLILSTWSEGPSADSNLCLPCSSMS